MKIESDGTLYAQSVLNVVGGLIILLEWRSLATPTVLTWEILTIASGVFVFFMRWQYPEIFKLKICSLFFIFNLLPIFPMLWFTRELMASSGNFGYFFEPYGLSAMTVSMLAPSEIWVGVLGILSFIGMALIQYWSLPLDVHNILPSPVILCTAYGSFALILLSFRIISRRLHEKTVRFSERDMGMRKLLGTLHSMQDLINSPMQALIIDSELLRVKYPETTDLSERIRRSVKKIEDVNELIAETLADSKPKIKDVSISHKK